MGDPGPAPDLALYEANLTDDCRQFDEWSKFTGWQTDYQQVGKGAFNGSLGVGFAEDIQVNRCVFNRELLIYASPPEGSVAFVVPYSDGRRGVAQGHELGPRDVLIVPAGVDGFLRTAESLAYYVVVVPLARFQDALQRHDPNSDREFRYGCVTTFPVAVCLALQDSLARIVETPDLLTPEHVLELLMQGLCQDAEEIPGTLRMRNRLGYVRQARGYIEERLQHGLSLTEVSSAMGINRRTLELAFRDVLDLSPLDYLRSRRLNAIRASLRSNRGDYRRVSISELAAQFGQTHPGYFSLDYKALFGELPSKTARG